MAGGRTLKFSKFSSEMFKRLFKNLGAKKIKNVVDCLEKLDTLTSNEMSIKLFGEDIVKREATLQRQKR